GSRFVPDRRPPSWRSAPRRQADVEARAAHVALRVDAVRHQDAAAMRLDDLLGDAEAEAGVGAVFLARRTLAVEALEDRLELVRRQPRPVVAHAHPHLGAGTRRLQPDG